MVITAGIGEMVDPNHIKDMNEFIETHGLAAFRRAVYHEAFQGIEHAYIHPHNDMRSTKGFEEIQSAFINAYT